MKHEEQEKARQKLQRRSKSQRDYEGRKFGRKEKKGTKQNLVDITSKYSSNDGLGFVVHFDKPRPDWH